MIFDKKTRALTFASPLLEDVVSTPSYRFVHEYIMSKVRADSYLDVSYYLTSKFWENLDHLLTDFLFNYFESSTYN